MKIYLIARWIALALLITHTILRIFISVPNIPLDLILYNLVIIAAIASLYLSPLHNDSIGVASLSLSLISWSIGSILTSITAFISADFPSELASNIAYTLFYPFALIALPRLSGKRKKFAAVEILDATIFGLGLSAIFTTVLISLVLPDLPGSSANAFFTVLFPICDLALLIAVVLTLATQKLNLRVSLLTVGIGLFSATDFYYLWLALENRYSFGQLSDDGWILGITLLALSLWSPPSKGEKEITIHPSFVALSVFMSPALLAAIALWPGFFPTYILIPTIATLLLAFLRMSIVLHHARNLGEEKILARTDELTGLPNRRRLIAELDSFSKVEGALLLLDLNGFKSVNDRYGHEIGDRILQQVAHRFSRALPTGAVLSRLGGDEFGVLIEGDNELTLEIAHALRATLSYPFTMNGEKIEIGVAIGHVQNDGNGDLMGRADAAMYEAKKSGEGVAMASPALQP